MTAPRVRRLEQREVGTASQILGRAFAGDPFIAHTLSSSWRRKLAYPPFFRTELYALTEAGTVYAAEEDGVVIGVAAWVPPDALTPSAGVRRRSKVNELVVRALFPRAARRLFGAFEFLGERHPAEPHWYLAFVGLEATTQGRGIGARLLAPVLEEADGKGLPCYLETPFSGTHPFYRRLGFEVTGELRPIDGAPPAWSMTRPPTPRP